MEDGTDNIKFTKNDMRKGDISFINKGCRLSIFIVHGTVPLSFIYDSNRILSFLFELLWTSSISLSFQYLYSDDLRIETYKINYLTGSDSVLCGVGVMVSIFH